MKRELHPDESEESSRRRPRPRPAKQSYAFDEDEDASESGLPEFNGDNGSDGSDLGFGRRVAG